MLHTICEIAHFSRPILPISWNGQYACLR